ncbi:hypothetical protein AB0C96_41795 [Streptomyces sp. NPDC048506]|uniref:carboxymuconolactone decarboxylase family protein n=1 Tax=Streptomyces sp. NPDC048506 TaxID=3155028 RepID=UPI00341272A0
MHGGDVVGFRTIPVVLEVRRGDAGRNGVEQRGAERGAHLLHTAKLAELAAGPELIAALREQRPLPDIRLETVRTFTLAVLDHAGAVPADSVQAFLDQGFTRQNALEVVLGIGAYTLSTLANRLTDAPIDPQLAPYA